MSKRRVVITGLGCISAVGLNTQENWSNIKNGVNGIRNIEHFDTERCGVKFAGTVQNFDPSEVLTPKDAKKMDTFIQYGMVAAAEALEDSGLEVTDENAGRIGAAIGSGIGGLPYIQNTVEGYFGERKKKVSPFFVPGSIINMISGNLSIKYGLRGPNISIVTACTTGTHNIGDAARMIEYGDADVMVAGGAEQAVCEIGVQGFAAARALSTRNDDPATASRPFDQDRDGFVMGDGAGVLILEELEHAKKRGAKIYAELSGYGLSGDAYHMTSPRPDGSGAGGCMLNALRNAGSNVSDVDYVNAHGTSTPVGDVAETQAIKATMGDHAKNLVVSSTKSMIGHLLGAAGGVEAVYSALAVHEQVAPPTMNIINQDPECDLDYAANEAKEMKIDVAMSNSFGFGGTNGTLVFKRFTD